MTQEDNLDPSRGLARGLTVVAAFWIVVALVILCAGCSEPKASSVGYNRPWLVWPYSIPPRRIYRV